MGMNEMSEAMILQRAEDETDMSSAISLKQYCEYHECTDCIFYYKVLHAEDDEGDWCIKGETWKTLTKPFMQNYEKSTIVILMHRNSRRRFDGLKERKKELYYGKKYMFEEIFDYY